jgi:hypothetical protein
MRNTCKRQQRQLGSPALLRPIQRKPSQRPAPPTKHQNRSRPEQQIQASSSQHTTSSKCSPTSYSPSFMHTTPAYSSTPPLSRSLDTEPPWRAVTVSHVHLSSHHYSTRSPTRRTMTLKPQDNESDVANVHGLEFNLTYDLGAFTGVVDRGPEGIARNAMKTKGRDSRWWVGWMLRE